MKRATAARPQVERRQAGPRPVEHTKRLRRRNDFLPVAIGITGGVALATAAFWFFKKQAEYVVRGVADPYDTAVFDLVETTHHPTMDKVMNAMTQLGTHVAIGSAAGVIALLMLRKKRPHDAWTVVISTAGAMGLNSALKAIFQRQRPLELARIIKLPSSHSFPSGHALLSAASYPIITHHLVERASAPVQLLAHSITGAVVLAVGYSRVYFAVHFPSDVLAGFAAGLGWLGLTSLTHTLVDREMALKKR